MIIGFFSGKGMQFRTATLSCQENTDLENRDNSLMVASCDLDACGDAGVARRVVGVEGRSVLLVVDGPDDAAILWTHDAVLNLKLPVEDFQGAATINAC